MAISLYKKGEVRVYKEGSKKLILEIMIILKYF